MEALSYLYEEATLGDSPCSYMYYCKALERALSELSLEDLKQEDLEIVSKIKEYIKDCPEVEIEMEKRDPYITYYEE
jgi:hypothetical protein